MTPNPFRDEPMALGDLKPQEIQIIKYLMKAPGGLRLIDIACLLKITKQSASEYVYDLKRFNIIIRRGNRYYVE